MITSSESKLDRSWLMLRESGRTGLVPYFTAGFPSIGSSLDAIRAAETHADVIEVGVPFSDPLADGPTIQASTFKALANGMTLPKTLDLIARAELRVPVVLFTYVNPVLQYGVDRLLRDAADIGVAGLLLTDVPAGADPALETKVQQSPLDLVRLVAPTTSPVRARAALEGAQGFVYLVARLGVTGASSTVAADLGASVQRVRDVTSLPIAVGFGISTPQQARTVAGLADGVVVGSALVDVLGAEGVEASTAFLGRLRAALDER